MVSHVLSLSLPLHIPENGLKFLVLTSSPPQKSNRLSLAKCYDACRLAAAGLLNGRSLSVIELGDLYCYRLVYCGQLVGPFAQSQQGTSLLF